SFSISEVKQIVAESQAEYLKVIRGVKNYITTMTKEKDSEITRLEGKLREVAEQATEEIEKNKERVNQEIQAEKELNAELKQKTKLQVELNDHKRKLENTKNQKDREIKALTEAAESLQDDLKKKEREKEKLRLKFLAECERYDQLKNSLAPQVVRKLTH